MGMYDHIAVNCPHCGAVNEDQTKMGECFLGYYALGDDPIMDVIIEDHDWEDCPHCGEPFHVALEVKPVYVTKCGPKEI